MVFIYKLLMSFKKNLFLVLVLWLSTGLLYSQENRFDYSLSHPIKFGQQNRESKPQSFSAGTDSFKVVAILVQFQEDSDPLTSGNGLFDLSDKYYDPSTGKDTVIDSPPYDSSYFADHLKFLQNYFYKSSKGKLNMTYDLFGQVINLPNKMQAYSPQRNESNIKLGNLFQDSWARADSFINFTNYDLSKTAFVIFHAGVGRDVDLSSIYGFDPTPYDIPSVYLGLKNLQEFYGSSYNGFLTSDGVYIDNSLIIPSTELRELQLSGGNYLLELGMNGILAASFGSYLGLPDLFNTSSGKTAIGRFGLMDGQSIFSYNGIFPPEPSAWEKTYLGWVDPVVVSSGSKTFNIPTSSKSIQRDSTIYKVLISTQEYFLIENKNRDPENNGQTIYSHNRDSNYVNNYPQDLANGFYYSSGQTSLYLLDGNVTDVETFDWSLPGLINAENNYRGGILVWHIDENVINARISSNTINNDINHKGVDLEEAKGAQEIGVTYNTFFGPVTGDGTPVDYWFNGYHEVPSSIYKNEFTPTSIPNSLSYSLANNNILITGFSGIDTLMTFNVSVGGTQLSPISSFPKFVGIDTSGNSQAIAFDFTGDESEEIFTNSNIQIYGYNSNGSDILPGGIISNSSGKYIPASFEMANIKYIVSLQNNAIEFLDSSFAGTQFNFSSSPSTPPLSIGGTDFVYVGRADGKIYKYNPAPNEFVVDSSAAVPINQFSGMPQDTFTYITNAYKYLVVGNITSPTSTDILIVNNNNKFLLNGTQLNLNYSIAEIKSSPVLADVNNDGRQEIIFVGDDKVYALNGNGILLENFPADFNEDITSGISVADVNNDNVYDLIFVADNGDMYAYGVNGKVVGGFPVKVGPNTTSTPALANLNDTLGIAVVCGDGYLYGFKTNSVYNDSKVLWKNYLKDKYLSNNNFISGNVPVSISGKLPPDLVYNWPNPVYDNSTFIRYFLNGNASSVTVKILDLSGELVTTLPATAYSKSDNEVRWDVSGVQSGIYYGVIEAEIDGSSESQVIKIAVVK